jgi:hypothetical protein
MNIYEVDSSWQSLKEGLQASRFPEANAKPSSQRDTQAQSSHIQKEVAEISLGAKHYHCF